MDNSCNEGPADHEMAKDTDKTDHPWSTLETITTFDQGIP